MQIRVIESLSGKSLVLDEVELHHTVKDLKWMMYKKTCGECPVEMQRLILGGKVMGDYYNMKDYNEWRERAKLGSHDMVLHLSLRIPQGGRRPSFFKRPRQTEDITFFVRDCPGKIHVIQMKSYQYVEELKVALFDLKVYTVPPGSQSLMFLGREMKDDKTLADYGVSDNDRIELTLPDYEVMPMEHYEALVKARRLSRQMAVGAIPKVDYPNVLSIVAPDVSATFALVRQHPTMFTPGFFDGVSGKGRPANEIMKAHGRDNTIRALGKADDGGDDDGSSRKVRCLVTYVPTS